MKRRISGITVCVDYADVLERTLPIWSNGLDDVLVVTMPRDQVTRALCTRMNIAVHATDTFRRHGAWFNKAGALDEALATMAAVDWLLFFDADILPPRDWQEQLENTELQSGYLYGATRLCDCGCLRALDPPGVMPGCFHLFCNSDPRVHARPLLGHWSNASGYDTIFARRWTGRWRKVPFAVTHLGNIGEKSLFSGWAPPDGAESKKSYLYLCRRCDITRVCPPSACNRRATNATI